MSLKHDVQQEHFDTFSQTFETYCPVPEHVVSHSAPETSTNTLTATF